MLLGTDNEGRTSWHLAAEKGFVGVLHKMCEWAEEKLTTEKIKNKLLLGKDSEGRTAWHLAAEKENVGALHKICEWAEEKLTREERKNNFL